MIRIIYICETDIFCNNFYLIFYREPVDRLEHPDYHQIIDTPMDLRTVKEDLLGGNYETPIEFAKDMRLIFTNSRNYNTNKRSRVCHTYYYVKNISSIVQDNGTIFILDIFNDNKIISHV